MATEINVFEQRTTERCPINLIQVYQEAIKISENVVAVDKVDYSVINTICFRNFNSRLSHINYFFSLIEFIIVHFLGTKHFTCLLFRS